jgi:hypothetical protein
LAKLLAVGLAPTAAIALAHNPRPITYPALSVAMAASELKNKLKIRAEIVPWWDPKRLKIG